MGLYVLDKATKDVNSCGWLADGRGGRPWLNCFPESENDGDLELGLVVSTESGRIFGQRM